MVPSSIQATPMMAKNTAPITHEMIAAGPARPGGYITKPRGELHSMWNAGDVPARMIEVISPGGFEHFFREMTELVAAGPPLFADVLELGARYGLEFGEPEWLPDVIGRYGLTPPPSRDS